MIINVLIINFWVIFLDGGGKSIIGRPARARPPRARLGVKAPAAAAPGCQLPKGQRLSEAPIFFFGPNSAARKSSRHTRQGYDFRKIAGGG
jgi:hypothetical protein